jgi:heme/copper-type cytochrome/quinol oxidase subunit 2
LLTGVLLIIFTALMISFSHHEETASFMWTVIYTVLFFVGSLTTWWNQKRKAITGILINLFVFIIPVFPVLLFGWYYAWKTKQYNNQEPGLQRLEPLDLNQYFIYAETGGAVLFLVLLATYIGKVYRRWYSLPED